MMKNLVTELPLSLGEKECLHYFSQEKSISEISDALNISPYLVEFRLQNIFRRHDKKIETELKSKKHFKQ